MVNKKIRSIISIALCTLIAFSNGIPVTAMGAELENAHEEEYEYIELKKDEQINEVAEATDLNDEVYPTLSAEDVWEYEQYLLEMDQIDDDFKTLAESQEYTYKNRSSVDPTSYEGSCGDDARYSFNVNTGILSIEGNGDMENYGDTSNVPWADFKKQITQVVIGEGITSIGMNNFANCSRLQTVTIPGSVKYIGIWAFFSCNSLEAVSTHAEVIDQQAFRYCRSLANVELNDTVNINTKAFSFCNNLTRVTLPKSIRHVSNPFQGSENLERIDVIPPETEDETTYYTSVDGVLYNKELTSIVCFPPAWDSLF